MFRCMITIEEGSHFAVTMISPILQLCIVFKDVRSLYKLHCSLVRLSLSLIALYRYIVKFCRHLFQYVSYFNLFQVTVGNFKILYRRF